MQIATARLKNLVLSSWHPFAWLVLIGFLCYGQTLGFGFSYLDDNILIVERVDELRDLSRLGTIFTRDVFHVPGGSAGYYRPLLILSFMVDAFFSGGHPFGYHFLNVILHLVATILVFLLLVRLEFSRLKSFCFSLLFLVHPALAQAVAWVPGRNDPLLAVFILASFLFFHNYLRTLGWKDLGWHLVFFLCALLTKESAVVFPAVLVFYFVLVKKEKLKDFPRKTYLGWLGCLGVWFVLRTNAVDADMDLVSEGLMSTVENSPALLLYLGKVFFPFNLCVFPILRDASLGFGILAFFLMVFMIAGSREKQRETVAFGLLWFFLFLFFALLKATTPASPADFLEHRLYLPMIGLVLALTSLKPFAHLKWRREVEAGVFIIFFGVFLTVNIVHARNFKDRLSFWQNAVQCSPHAAVARGNLGAMYYLEGKYEAAVYEYRQALDLNPDQKMIHSNLGLILTVQKEWDRAEDEFLIEISKNPSYVDAYYNFGLLRYNQGREKEGRQLMEKVLDMDPEHAQAREILQKGGKIRGLGPSF